ncbi:hypothetical protein OESDEN_05483 [Oesophagostomum dentatum]|uniref:SGNH domain-containing protein n=1 Tax=Oesophagostomum dentatum TaxID=61180 RepID=A0A0B1TBE2_OESDE|nr:hypothetical protein OESDEN_05483 [Oesophagostomum dentatum]
MAQKREDIQGLRGCAVTMVVLFHFFPASFPNGYVGVDIMRRILPLYYMVIFLTLIVLLVLLPSNFLSPNIASSRKAVLFTLNIKGAEDITQDYQIMENVDVRSHLEAEGVKCHLARCVQMRERFIPQAPSYSLNDYNNHTYPSLIPRKDKIDNGRGGQYRYSHILAVLPLLNIPEKWRAQHTVFLTNGGLVYIGDLSYALYLFHWPMYVIVKQYPMWDQALMRYLISKEGQFSRNMGIEGCNYSDRFVGSVIKPTVCEVMIPDMRKNCKYNINYISMLEELKPDIVFLIIRPLTMLKPFQLGVPISKDEIFRNQMKFVETLENMVKKVYIVQALPSCVPECVNAALAFTRNGTALREIKDALIIKNDVCKKCEIIDYMPVLVDDEGRYLGYDTKTNLMFLDEGNHFTRLPDCKAKSTKTVASI